MVAIAIFSVFYAYYRHYRYGEELPKFEPYNTNKIESNRSSSLKNIQANDMGPDLIYDPNYSSLSCNMFHTRNNQ